LSNYLLEIPGRFFVRNSLQPMMLNRNGIPIDELSQTLLWLFRDADEQRSASQLVDEVTVDDTQKIRYRLKKLRRAGLIDHVESIKHQEGAQNPTKYHVINDVGLEWLYEHQENVEDAVGRKRYLDSLDKLREIITDVRADVRDLADDLEELEVAREEAVANQMEDIEKRLGSLESKIREEEKDRKADIRQLQDNLDRLDRFESRLDDLETELDGINLGRLEQRQHELVERVNINYFLLARAWRRTFYNAREMQRLNLAKVATGDADPTMGDEETPPMFDEVDPTDADLTAPEDDRPRP